MIGVVTAGREALLRVIVRAANHQEQEVEAIINTGFTGFLTLPRTSIAVLALSYHSETVATLADGSAVALPLYEATVIWNEQEREVLVLEAEGGVLLGMSLLTGCRMQMDVIDGGSVTIEALS